MKASLEFTKYESAGDTTHSEAILRLPDGIIRGSLTSEEFDREVEIFENTTRLNNYQASELFMETVWCNCSGELTTLEVDIELPQHE